MDPPPLLVKEDKKDGGDKDAKKDGKDAEEGDKKDGKDGKQFAGEGEKKTTEDEKAVAAASGNAAGAPAMATDNPAEST